jgi:hypothetical protein
VATGFSNGDRVVTTKPCRGFDLGLSATVVSVHTASGMVIIAPLTGEPQSVFLSVDPLSLRHRGSRLPSPMIKRDDAVRASNVASHG